jgi:hypothetical protein
MNVHYHYRIRLQYYQKVNDNVPAKQTLPFRNLNEIRAKVMAKLTY